MRYSVRLNHNRSYVRLHHKRHIKLKLAFSAINLEKRTMLYFANLKFSGCFGSIWLCGQYTYRAQLNFTSKYCSFIVKMRIKLQRDCVFPPYSMLVSKWLPCHFPSFKYNTFMKDDGSHVLWLLYLG